VTVTCELSLLELAKKSHCHLIVVFRKRQEAHIRKKGKKKQSANETIEII
jgi:hypothetical protein